MIVSSSLSQSSRAKYHKVFTSYTQFLRSIGVVGSHLPLNVGHVLLFLSNLNVHGVLSIYSDIPFVIVKFLQQSFYVSGCFISLPSQEVCIRLVEAFSFPVYQGPYHSLHVVNVVHSHSWVGHGALFHYHLPGYEHLVLFWPSQAWGSHRFTQQCIIP